MKRFMKRQFLRSVIAAILVTIGLGHCLFFDQISRSSRGVLSSVGRETMAVFRDPGTQWMVFLCAGIYFITFAVLHRRGWGMGSGVWEGFRKGEHSTFNIQRSTPNAGEPTPNPSKEGNLEQGKAESGKTFNFQLSTFNFQLPDLWLCGLLLIAALAYALDYERASTSTQALVLLAGAAIGKGARLWVNWGKAETLKSEKLKEESGKPTPSPSLEGNVEQGKAESGKPEWQGNVWQGNEGTEEPGFQHVSVSDFQNLPSSPHSQPSTLNHQLGARTQTILLALIFLLALASAWHPGGAMQFQYRGLNRWSGPWDNPNVFGMLMGVGVVIGVGMLVAGCRLKARSRFIGVEGSTSNQRSSAFISGLSSGFRVPTFNFQLSTFNARWLLRLFCLAALACCGIGLLKSYSRGAWLGTGLGFAILAFQHFRFQNFAAANFSRGSRPFGVPLLGGVRGGLPHRFTGWLGRNWRPLFVLLASLLVLSYWQFRQTQFHPVRRAFSVGNKNDFSWRNRVAAWEGSLAMMADRPVAGFGWNQPEKIYDQFYRSPKLSEGMAIQLNHYFTLGMSLGLPALICFGMYVGLALRGKAEIGKAESRKGDSTPHPQSLSPVEAEREGNVESGNVPTTEHTEHTKAGTDGRQTPFPRAFQPSTLNHQLKTACRAGAVVLLVGLWFDGGLFNLATAAPLWVLLELGRVGRVTPCAPGDVAISPEGAHGVTRPTLEKVSRILRGSRFQAFAVPLFFGLLLLTGLLWAKGRDPFHREWLSVRTSTGEKFSAMMVMPDRGGPFPVVVWCHGSGGSMESSGETLQQFAAQGMAAVGFNYSQTNSAQFDEQFAAVLEELEGKAEIWKAESRNPVTTEHTEHTKGGTENVQHSTFNVQPPTSNTGNHQPLTFNHQLPIAWVGNSLGAQRQLSFLARHPERQPVALVRLNGGMVEELGGKAESGKWERSTFNVQHSTFKAQDPRSETPNPRRALRAWIAHGENDEVFPASDARRVAESLRAAGAEVRLDVFPGRGHGFGEDQPLLVKRAAEFCAKELGGTTPVPVTVRPGLFYYWLPAGLFGGVLLLRHLRHRSPVPVMVKSSRWLRSCAAMALLAATLVTAAHLALPLFRVTPSTLKLARQWCVRPELRADFDWLGQQPGATSCRIRDLLEHVQLASLQRGQFAASLPEKEWREFVLSPWIDGTGEDIAWRRPLWEWMAPRVRRETDAEQAAVQVTRQLQLRVASMDATVMNRSVKGAWTKGETDQAGFERLTVAGLRSVGIAARTATGGGCEILSDSSWKHLAPQMQPSLSDEEPDSVIEPK